MCPKYKNALFNGLSFLEKSRTVKPCMPNQYSPFFLSDYEKAIGAVLVRRESYRMVLDQHLKSHGQHDGTPFHKPLWDSTDFRDVPTVAFLGSSSRGGSSFTVYLLSRQAESAGPINEKILVLPGEIHPLLTLAHLYPPFSGRLSDDLNVNDAIPWKLEILRREMFCEIGFPLSSTVDIRLYAIQLYGRLVLQWPELRCFDNTEVCISKIAHALNETCTSLNSNNERMPTYYDSARYEILLLLNLQKAFPKIDIRYYDIPDAGARKSIEKEKGVADGSPTKFVIEEAPFILPAPWRYATRNELENGVFLLKDPADAFRLGFYRALFTKRFHLLQLSRNPESSINGLMKGWQNPFSFLTQYLPIELNIPGYSDAGNDWRKHRVSFSINNDVLKLLCVKEPVPLNVVASFQWAFAHSAILKYAHSNSPEKGFRYSFIPPFVEILENTLEAMIRICKILGVPFTSSLRRVAERKPHIMVTPGSGAVGENSWMNSPHRFEVIKAAKFPWVVDISNELRMKNLERQDTENLIKYSINELSQVMNSAQDRGFLSETLKRMLQVQPNSNFKLYARLLGAIKREKIIVNQDDLSIRLLINFDLTNSSGYSKSQLICDFHLLLQKMFDSLVQFSDDYFNSHRAGEWDMLLDDIVPFLNKRLHTVERPPFDMYISIWDGAEYQFFNATQILVRKKMVERIDFFFKKHKAFA